MYLPNRSLCEFLMLAKSAKTQRLEANLMRQFRGLEPILSPGSMKRKILLLPTGSQEITLKKA